MNNKKLVNNIIVCLSSFGAMTMFSSCGRKPYDVANFSQKLVDACNTNMVLENSNLKFEKFKLIGTDVEKNGFTFDVNFNGLSSLTDKTLGYASIGYKVPSYYFNDLDKDSSSSKLYEVFDKIVLNIKPESATVAPISNFTATNNAFVTNEPQIFKGFHNSKSMLFKLSSPEYNEDNHTISFESKVLVYVNSGDTSLELGLGVGFVSGGLGIGIGANTIEANGTFIATDKYTLNLTEEEYNSYSQNLSLVYDEVVKAINNKDNTRISASRENVKGVTFENADLLGHLDVNDVDEEMSK